MAQIKSPSGEQYESEADSMGTKAVRVAPTATGPGTPLPEVLRTKMENSLGADFSQVRVHQGSHVNSINAIAYTQGTNIHFAPGQFKPSTPAGQQLLTHELNHVVQQRQGKVKVASGLAQVTEKSG